MCNGFCGLVVLNVFICKPRHSFQETNMVSHERTCIFCFKPFQAKSRKARYCSPAHRVEYFRRRKRQEKQRIKNARKARFQRRTLELRLEDLQSQQEKTAEAIGKIQKQLWALPQEEEITA
jgi:hypothetical protein